MANRYTLLGHQQLAAGAKYSPVPTYMKLARYFEVLTCACVFVVLIEIKLLMCFFSRPMGAPYPAGTRRARAGNFARGHDYGQVWLRTVNTRILPDPLPSLNQSGGPRINALAYLRTHSVLFRRHPPQINYQSRSAPHPHHRQISELGTILYLSYKGILVFS